MDSSNRLNDRPRVLITGASSGIGAQLAKDYLEDGWQVFGCGRNRERLVAIKGINPLIFDIGVRDAVQSAGKQLKKLLGENTLDLIILNAGTCEYIEAPLQFDDQLFERVIHTNLVAVGYCLNAFLPFLSHDGRLALMSSSSIYLALPRAEAYGSSKAAINYLAATLDASFAGHKESEHIRVSVICPGFVDTPLTEKNDFPMPMRVDVHTASKEIRLGLAKGKREIHFPKRFTCLLKLLSILPAGVWRKITLAMAPENKNKDAEL